jgi:serine/threonine protein kinase
MADRIGQVLGKYQLTRVLGQGGFAEVYLGVHVHLGTEAAIKVLHTQLAMPSDVEKFRVESSMVAKLVHPNIVRVLDFDVQEGTPYLVMDYAPNGSLRQRMLPGRPLAPAEVLPIVLQIAEALQYAHEQKLVHRDIKPENMLLGRRSDALLSDFGIAVVAQSTSMQKTQGVAGTAAYMSPEQLQGKPRPASDLYSLGVVVYEWLAGERPFQGSFTEVASQHLFAPPPPLREKIPTIPPAVEQVVLTALAKDPKDRFGSVRAFANAFAQASGATGTFATFSTQVGTPPAFVQQTPTTPAGQPAPSLYSAETRLTPHVTPQLSTPAQTAVPPLAAAGQLDSSLLNAPTHLTPPSAAPWQAGMTPPLGVPPLASQTGMAQPSLSTPTAPTSLPPAQGWAAPGSYPGGQGYGGSEPAFPETAEVAYGGSGPAYHGGGRVPVDNPGAPIVPAPDLGKRKRKGGALRYVMIALAAVLVLALIGGGVYAFVLQPPASSTGATVMITPASSSLQKSYNITAVTGTPDTSKQQVAARQISVTTQGYSQTVNATGSQTTPGASATGTIAVYNWNPANSLSLSAGSSYPNTNGDGNAPSSIIIVLDAAVNLAPSGGVGSYTFTTVPAHVQQVGTIGNFPRAYLSSLLIAPDASAIPQSGGTGAFSYDGGSCSSFPGYCWELDSYSAFSGGVDPQTYTVVAQSDIDGTANNLIQANQPNAQQMIQQQLRSGEQQIGTPQCSPNVSHDHQAGDQASQVTVTVTFTCTGEAYSQSDAQALAQQLLTSEATSQLGTKYALVGKITTTQVSANPGDQGAVNLMISASGTWAYQFSTPDQQNLAKLIAGKTKSAATQTLLGQPGVAKVNISLTGGNGQLLPAAAAQITVIIQPVS